MVVSYAKSFIPSNHCQAPWKKGKLFHCKYSEKARDDLREHGFHYLKRLLKVQNIIVIPELVVEFPEFRHRDSYTLFTFALYPNCVDVIFLGVSILLCFSHSILWKPIYGVRHAAHSNNRITNFFIVYIFSMAINSSHKRQFP